MSHNKYHVGSSRHHRLQDHMRKKIVIPRGIPPLDLRHHHHHHHHHRQTSLSSSSQISKGDRDIPFINSFTRGINEFPICRELEKLLGMRNYNWAIDLNKHVELVNIFFNFKGERGYEKWKLFIITLKFWVIIRSKGFIKESICSWERLTSSLSLIL